MSRQPAVARLALLAPTDQHGRLCPRLEAAGFEVVACESRLDLLSEVFSVSPAVIVVRDDDRSGPSEQLCRSLLRQRQREPLVVVASLAEADAVQRAVWLERGVDAVLDDTMSLDESRSILRACLGRLREIQELQAHRDHLAACLDHVGDGVMIIDEAGRVLHANTISLDLLGVDPDVLRQQSAARLLNVMGVPRETIDRVLRTEESFSETVELHVGGELRDIEVGCRRLDSARAVEPRWMVRLLDRSAVGAPPVRQAGFRAGTGHDLGSALVLLRAQLRALEESTDPRTRDFVTDSVRRNLEDLSQRLDDRTGGDGPDDVDDGTTGASEIGLREWIEGVVVEVEPLFLHRRCALEIVVPPALEGMVLRTDVECLRLALRDVLVLLLDCVPPEGEARILAGTSDGTLQLRAEQRGGPAPDTPPVDLSALEPACRGLEARGGHLQQERPCSEGLALRLSLPLHSDLTGLSLV